MEFMQTDQAGRECGFFVALIYICRDRGEKDRNIGY